MMTGKLILEKKNIYCVFKGRKWAEVRHALGKCAGKSQSKLFQKEKERERIGGRKEKKV